jgi:hypothetical protein
MHFAAESGDLDIIKTLLKAKGNAFVIDVGFGLRLFFGGL